MRPTLFSLLLSAAIPSVAQQQVKIAEATALENPEPVRKSKGAEDAMKAGGINNEQQALVLQYGDRDHWPEGLKNDSARKANAPYIQNYTGFRLARFTEDSVPKSVVMFPAASNVHMPEEMRPLADLYMLLPDAALADVNSGRSRPEISRGPKWKTLPTATIVKPEDIYATYDMADDSVALAALSRRGMSQPEIDAVVFRSIERNWPDGIDSFEERQKLLPKFTKYKAFVGAKWDDKVLLIVPVEKNKKQPALMRPYVDLYFVYNQSAVKIKEKKKK